MIASSDTEAREEVINHSKQGSLPFERRPDGSDQASDGYPHNQTDVEPVNVFPPVCSRHLGVCDVWFSWIIALISIGLRGLCRRGWLR